MKMEIGNDLKSLIVQFSGWANVTRYKKNREPTIRPQPDPAACRSGRGGRQYSLDFTELQI